MRLTIVMIRAYWLENDEDSEGKLRAVRVLGLQEPNSFDDVIKL